MIETRSLSWIRSAISAALFSTGLLLSSTCGIPNFNYIAGPEWDGIDRGDVPGAVKFVNNCSINDVDGFLGYILYYKLYNHSADASATAESPRAAELADRIEILREPEQIGIGRLTARGFHRVIVDDDNTILPTISIRSSDRQVCFDVTVNIDPDSPESDRIYWSVNGNTYSHNIYRNTEETNLENTSFYKHFNPENSDYVATDDDADASIATAQSNRTLYVAFYVVAYGIAGDTFQPFYSTPRCLRYINLHGSISLSCPPP